MTKKSFSFAENDIKNMISMTSGFFDHTKLDFLINSFENSLSKINASESTVSNLFRILHSIWDKVSFFSECIAHTHFIDIITTLAHNSNYLTDIVVRNPEYIHLLFNSDFMNKKITQEDLKNEISQNLSHYKTFRSRVNFLRLFKRRILLKIGMNDILENSNLSETTKQLSILAIVLNKTIFELSLQQILDKHKIEKLKNEYSIISLGKLGGNELNYSSDVDFIILFDKNSTYDQQRNLNFSTILDQAIKLFIEESTNVTSKGYIYRVDLRLRPFGKNSPLAGSLAEYIKYYETRGENWERQMLIKMNFLCGSKNLYDKFSNYLKSFIYPANLSRSPFEQIISMKKTIEKYSTFKNDIKRFPGGIRDIEFSVQALQLLNGGKISELRTGNTLEAVEKLCKFKLLNKRESQIYKDAYVFYRRIEHYLQLMNDTQTHHLPDNEELLVKISDFLGFRNVNDFQNQVRSYQKEVRDIFNSILTVESQDKKNNIELLDFKDKRRAVSNFKFLKYGTGLLQQKKFDKRTTQYFEEIENSIIDYFSKTEFRDICLENLTKVIRALPMTSIFYRELKDQKLLEALLKFCEFDQKGVDLISLNPHILEFLLNRSAFGKEYFISEKGLETNNLIFSLSLQYVLKIIDHNELSEILSKNLLKIIRDKLFNKIPKEKFVVFAQGSFGADLMNFNSDIDLIIVANSSVSQKENDLIGDLIEEISEKISPFKIDLRLRPEGNKGPLVWEFEKYKKYLNKRADVWELQSFLKTKLIYGNEKLFDDLSKKVYEVIRNLNNEDLLNEIVSMRKKYFQHKSSAFGNLDFKFSKGGLSDLDFLFQYQILKLYNLYDQKSFSNYIKLVEKTCGNLDTYQNLMKNYMLMKDAIIAVKIVFNVSNSILPKDKTKQKMLSKLLEIETDSIDSFFRHIMTFNNKTIEKYLT